MCPGLILGQGSEFQPQIWKVDLIYFIVTPVSFLLSTDLLLICFLSFSLCEYFAHFFSVLLSLFFLFPYHPFDSSLSLYLFHLQSLFPLFPFLSTPPTFFPSPSIYPPRFPARAPHALYSCHPLTVYRTSCPPPFLPSVSLVPLTPHTAPIPRKPLQTASAIKARSQSARQPVSQPANLLLRLKITVVPVARLLSSSDTHQRSS